MLEKQMQVATLIHMYRVRGHLIADLDPLAWKEPQMHRELDPATYGLTIWDLDREFLTGGLGGTERMPLGEILRVLRDAYCRTIGIEYMHIQDPAEKRWIQRAGRGRALHAVAEDEQRHILERLNAAEAFEKFLATKYVGQKRFGIEGCRVGDPDARRDPRRSAADDGPRRRRARHGRTAAGSTCSPTSSASRYDQIFKEFEGYVDPASTQGSGDVKYHLGATGKFVSPAGADIAVELAANPSHLEAVDPVVEGMARAKQDSHRPAGPFSVLPHPHARRRRVRRSGRRGRDPQPVRHQGLPRRRHHPPRHQQPARVHDRARVRAQSSQYCHRRREDGPGADLPRERRRSRGVRPRGAARLRLPAAFHKDVVIDMVCYRRHGHNEGDDPSYTQPLMYKRIDERRSVRKLYTEALVKRGDLTLEEAESALDDFQHEAAGRARRDAASAPPTPAKAARPPAPVGRAAPRRDRRRPGRARPASSHALTELPEGFTVHPKLAKQFETRAKMFDEGEVDWATAESLAFGSLAARGHRHPPLRPGHAARHVLPAPRGARRLRDR